MSELQPSLEDITRERKQATMAASRLEADILQVIIRHAQEHHTPTELILLALGNCTTHWSNKMVNTRITKALYAELNHNLMSSAAVREVYGDH